MEENESTESDVQVVAPSTKVLASRSLRDWSAAPVERRVSLENATEETQVNILVKRSRVQLAALVMHRVKDHRLMRIEIVADGSGEWSAVPHGKAEHMPALSAKTAEAAQGLKQCISYFKSVFENSARTKCGA
ncbi:hypothetical protein [Variibacter gotjawalensis]|uniref:hypothetical protein n=1 Tax=Variibacter gotjawalensis TaxID=1333996 RepID=UPI00102BA388|nr:hypothetical protein [Variibacter gotjawalensis]NIK47717.1 hypothetical protein [Variibacter gotjawalensis]